MQHLGTFTPVPPVGVQNMAALYLKVGFRVVCFDFFRLGVVQWVPAVKKHFLVLQSRFRDKLLGI